MAHAIELAPPPSPSPPPAGLLDLDEPKVFAPLHRQEHVDTGVWHLDTGGTNHMPGVRDIFAELDTAVRGKVRFGNGSVVAIEGQGKIIFECRNGEHRALTGVYYIPKLNANLVSLGQLDENGCNVRIFHGVCTIRDTARQLLARVQRTRNQLYLIKITVARPMCLSARTQEAAWLWHARFGHLYFDALRRLARQDMVRGLPQIDQVEQLCDCCVITKQRRSPFPWRSLFCAEDRLELVHGDLCGPISPATPGGKKHFLLLVDDASRYMWLALLQNKREAAVAIKRFQARSEAESGCRLKLLRTDNGGEFTSAEFAAHCAESGVKRQLTAPYSPQQNRVVERRNQTILGMAQSLLKAKSVPACYWGEAVTTAVFLLNRAPTKCLDNKTPYEAWFGRKPAVGHLRTFGCLAYVKDVRPHVTKLQDRNKPTVFLATLRDPKPTSCSTRSRVVFK